jgi:DNA gyrase/topoisomerase IV subunit B
MTRKYDESDITGFTRDIEKIQARPAMYLGPMDSDGVFTSLRECLDNAVDEARAGRNSLVNIVHTKGEFWVQDKGVGIPVGIHKKMKISTLTHVLTNLQSSGKMTIGGAYKGSIGTHGAGVKCTNATSSLFEVWTYREDAGGWHYTKFEDGIEKVKPKKSDGPKVPGFGRAKYGTIIHFVPSEKFFKKHKINLTRVAQWARITSYMNAGLMIRLTNGDKTKEWKEKDGIKAYLDHRLLELKATSLSKKYIFHNSESLELSLAFADVEGCQIEFFTNTVRNKEEGFHADDLYRALYDSLKPYIGKAKFTPTDVRDGMVGLLNYKIDAPIFNGQVKEKLVDDRVKGECYKECLIELGKFWKANPGLAKDVVSRASLLRSKTADFLKDKKLIKNINAAKKKLATKLAPIQGKAPVNEREIFLVEGDSAGGGAIRARNKYTQAIYPLRGKPLNVQDTAKDKINNNAEVVGLLAALGIDLGGKRPNLDIPYGKIINMADADVDGDHINVLLLGIMWKYLPSLFHEGKVFVVKAPLYKSRHKGVLYFGMSKEEVFKQTGTTNCDVTYIKGWGELSESDLGVGLDPNVRKLYKVLPPDKKGANRFQLLLGKNPAFRKQLFGVT